MKSKRGGIPSPPPTHHKEKEGRNTDTQTQTHTHTELPNFFLNYWFISIHKYHKSKFIIGIYLYINTNSKKFGNFVKKHRGEEGGEREETHTYIYS